MPILSLILDTYLNTNKIIELNHAIPKQDIKLVAYKYKSLGTIGDGVSGTFYKDNGWESQATDAEDKDIIFVDLPFLRQFDVNGNHPQDGKGLLTIPLDKTESSQYYDLPAPQDFHISTSIPQSFRFEIYNQFGEVYDRKLSLVLIFEYSSRDLF